jgi:acyl-CoA thioester hydrolase
MIAAPFMAHRGQVRPDWADDNKHMNLAYYLVMFDAASDAIFEVLDIGLDYRHREDRTAFAAETHLVYEREMNVGDWASIATTIIDVDDKRLHLAHEMTREGESERACLQEILFINVNLTTRRAATWSEAIMSGLLTARDIHAKIARPTKLGRHIGIRK